MGICGIVLKMMFDIIRKTGENTSSMFTDIINKRKTEIDFLNVKIIKLGLEAGISVTQNQEIYDKILIIEKSRSAVGFVMKPSGDNLYL